MKKRNFYLLSFLVFLLVISSFILLVSINNEDYIKYLVDRSLFHSLLIILFSIKIKSINQDKKDFTPFYFIIYAIIKAVSMIISRVIIDLKFMKIITIIDDISIILIMIYLFIIIKENEKRRNK